MKLTRFEIKEIRNVKFEDCKLCKTQLNCDEMAITDCYTRRRIIIKPSKNNQIKN